MPRYFTHYWSTDTCEWHFANDGSGQPLAHTAGCMFAHKGITAGDVVYGINVFQGPLYVIGRMTVGQLISSFEEAQTVLGPDVWEAPEHLIAAEGAATPMYFTRQLPWDLVEQLRFVAPEGGESPLILVDDDAVDRKALRDVRELTQASAELLDAFIAEPFMELDDDDEDEDLDDDDDDDEDDLTDDELDAIAADFANVDQYASVSERATAIVTDYFQNEGFKVTVSEDESSYYDLLCTNDDNEEYHVMVCGTPQEELRFLMMDTDFAAASEDDDALVCVVTSADSDMAELAIFDADSLLDDFVYRPLQWGFWYAGDVDEDEEEE